MVLVSEEGYEKKVMEKLWKQTHEDSEHTDVVLQVDNTKFYLHSGVLAETCPAMLENIKKSCLSSPITSEKRYSAKMVYGNNESFSETEDAGSFFTEVIRYLYKGQVDLTANNKNKIRILSSKLQIKDLVNLCDIYEETTNDDQNDVAIDSLGGIPMDHEYFDKSMEANVTEPDPGDQDPESSDDVSTTTTEKNARYKCLHCDQEFSSIQNLNVHSQRCSSNNIMCCKCGKSFTDMIQYTSSSHYCFVKRLEIKRVEGAVCDYCLKAFYDPEVLANHEETHKCETCNKFFTAVERVKNHPCGKPGKMPIYECTSCEKNYTKKQFFINHQRSTHLKTGHVCKYCGKVLTNAKYLKKHLLTHTGGKLQTEYKCSFCSKVFKYEILLFRHYINENHLVDQIPYKCEKCDKVVPSQGIMNKHLKDHELRSYPCKECEKVYSSKCSLQHHFTSAHVKDCPYKCQHCCKRFAQHDNLRQHMKAFHKVREDLVCSFCAQKLSSKTSLKRHESKHNGVREYDCVLCDKKFAVEADVRRHLRLQHPKLVNICECGKSYKSADGLRKHKMRVHSGEMRPRRKLRGAVKPETDEDEYCSEESESESEEEQESCQGYVLEEAVDIYEI